MVRNAAAATAAVKTQKEWIMDAGGANWALLNIVGPLLLLLVLGWAFWRNRKARRGADRTERKTHELYDQEERARRERDGS
jgi:hypothetical protein